MENSRLIKYFTLATLMGMLIASPFFVVAYDDKTAHPALTDEIIDLFNLYYPKSKIDDTDKESIKKGSIGEDVDTRWMHHFYDPIYNRGLWGYSSSKVWALDTAGQAILDMGYVQGGGSVLATVSTHPFDSRTDYSWDRAIYDYVWADKKRGLEGLGHILHLLEDASVPDHTRNDAHPAVLNLGSPYEAWTTRFTDKTIEGLATNIFNENLKPDTFKILQESFYSLAKYSNENFFSKDTIFDKEYDKPTKGRLLSENFHNGVSAKFIYNDANPLDSFKLVYVKTDFVTRKDEYFIEDIDDKVLNDYWTHLSKQAVLHGAGVVKLFLEEADKERTSKMRLSQNKSLLDKISSSINSLFGDSNTSSPLIATLPPGAFDISVPLLNVSNNNSQPIQQFVAQDNSLNIPGTLLENSNTISGLSVNITNLEIVSPSYADVSFLVAPGFGGGEATTHNTSSNPEPSIQEDLSPKTTSNSSSGTSQPGAVEQVAIPVNIVPPDTTSPLAPIILEPNDNKIFTTKTILFRGTAEPLSVISQDLSLDTASTSDNGTWELSLSIEKQGTSTIEFYANDLAGNTSSSTPVTVFVDSQAPDIFLRVATCDKSLSPDSCLVATSTIALEWSSSAPDIDHFEITCTFNSTQCENFDFSNTNATSTLYTNKSGEGTYEFQAKSFDKLGNVSNEIAKEVAVSNRPVVINEIAWAGTAASSADGWIELFNRTDKSVSLDGWVLRAKTNTPYIPLSGAIAPHSYYLMERTDDHAVSNISADLIYGNDGSSWAFINASEPVVLSYASTTIDETAVCYRGSQWCGGSAQYQYLSMERVDPDVVGTDLSNWKSSMDEFIKNGTDANGKALNATPRARNSSNYLVSPNGSITSDKTLLKRNSPYLINRSGLTLELGKTLTIEPGVVIKFVSPNEPTFWVKGTLKALGTAEDPIVFTSFYDDEYGGDMNGDGVCDKSNASSTTMCPFAGAWRRIHIMASSIGSELDNAIIRYGGRWFNDAWPRSMVAVEKTGVTIRNSAFEYSQKYGLQLLGGGGLIENSVFQNNNVDTDSTGLIATGAAAIRGNVFNNNYFGLTLQSSTAAVENNVFNNNKSYAINVSGGLASFVGNSGSGNGKDGIIIRGQLNATTSPLVMHVNGLPYLVGSGVYEALEIPDKSSVDVDAGVVFKAQSDGIINVKGILNINGDSKDSVLFTSLVGDNSASDWWRGINVSKTGVLNGKGFTLRRGGVGCPWGTPCAGILVDQGKINIENARFDNNYVTGVRLYKSVGSTFSDVEFINHNEPKLPADDALRVIGLSIINSDIGVGALSFSNNTLGVYSTNSTISHIDSYAVDFSGNIVNSNPPDLF